MNHHIDHILVEEPTKKTILVVEDDVSLGVKITRAISCSMPYAALLLSDGFALEIVLELLQPELIILEEHLTTTSSILTSSQLHPLKGPHEIPLLMVCADLPQTRVEKGKAVSVRKPLDLDELLSIIEQVLAASSHDSSH
jgi:DNA-binding response OmpR family regulator